MVVASRKPGKIDKCPRCSNIFVTWDELDKEPYCCICGWRRSIRISSEQARDHFRTEREFWHNLFACEKDPDEVQNI